MVPTRVMRQGHLPLIIFLAIAIVIHSVFSFWYALPFWTASILIAWFHRDPQREISGQPFAIVSPVDGRVFTVEKSNIPILGIHGIRIQIRKNLLNLFHLRSPVEGKIMDIKVIDPDQDYLVPYAIWIQTDEADNVVLVAESARVMLKPRIKAQVGERIGQGQVFGYVPFGTRFDVYLVGSVRIHIEEKAVVHGGVNVLASFVHK